MRQRPTSRYRQQAQSPAQRNVLGQQWTHLSPQEGHRRKGERSCAARSLFPWQGGSLVTWSFRQQLDDGQHTSTLNYRQHAPRCDLFLRGDCGTVLAPRIYNLTADLTSPHSKIIDEGNIGQMQDTGRRPSPEIRQWARDPARRDDNGQQAQTRETTTGSRPRPERRQWAAHAPVRDARKRQRTRRRSTAPVFRCRHYWQSAPRIHIR